MAKKKGFVESEVSPNLIPMIDIMFLLLLFFMLGADMGQRELEEVTLPKAFSVKEDKATKGKDDRLTVNVFHRYPSEVKCAAYNAQQVCREAAHWRVGVKGKDYSDPEKLGGFLKREAEQYRPDPKQPISDRKVMIRADLSSPYGLVQRVMNTCAKVGIYKIDCGAARPAEDGRKSK
jgi:biopolymer transport protein ExbD